VRDGSEREAREALEILCRAYWQPLYSVARHRQLSVHDAQDAVQGFFESVLRRETFSTADETAGKLRQLLLRAFDNFCAQQWARTNRQKRGGGAEHVELTACFDSSKAERRFQKSGATATSIETLYNREWATSVLERGLEALRSDYAERGWQERYDLLVGPLLQQDESSLVQLSANVGQSAGNLRVSLHRMRGHFRDKIERELATTLDTDDPALIREEMAELFKAFA
jgi:RNA polymerase sigma-70 factor (ECF subfamily)